MRLGEAVQEVRATEATRATVKRFLEMLDHFHSNAQKLSAAGMVGYQLTRSEENSQTPPPQSSSADGSSAILDALYFQISLIAFLYGVLGLLVFVGVLVFAKCTGKAKEIGWRHILLENLSGSRLPHFFAHLCCLAGGIIGFVSAAEKSNKNLPLVLPVLMLLSSILNGTAKPEEKKNDSTASLGDASFRAPQPPPTRRNALDNYTFGSNGSATLFGPHVRSQRKKRTSDDSSSEPKLNSPEVKSDEIKIEITDENKESHIHFSDKNNEEKKDSLHLPHVGQPASSEELDERPASDMLATEDGAFEFTDLRRQP